MNDPDYTLALLGQNVLNSIQSEIFIGYNTDEQYKKAGMRFYVQQTVPFINIGAEYRIDRSAYYGAQKIYWNELLPYAGLSVPLNFSRGRWLTNLAVGSNISYHQEYFKGVYKDSIKNSIISALIPSYYSHTRFSRQNADLSFVRSDSASRIHRAISIYRKENQFLALANLFFPGLTSTNSVVVSGAIQQRDSLNQVRFSNGFPFARGYTAVNFYQMFGFGINYNFPLAYPDWGFADIIYFLRIRANLFYDDTYVPYYATNGPFVQTQYRSAGIEIYLDTNGGISFR